MDRFCSVFGHTLSKPQSCQLTSNYELPKILHDPASCLKRVFLVRVIILAIRPDYLVHDDLNMKLQISQVL